MTTTPWDTRRDAPDVPEERRPLPTHLTVRLPILPRLVGHPDAVGTVLDALPSEARLQIQQQDAHDWLQSLDRLPSLDDERSLMVVP